MKQTIQYGYGLHEELEMAMSNMSRDKMNMSQNILAAVVDLYVLTRLADGATLVGKDDFRSITSTCYHEDRTGKTFMVFKGNVTDEFCYVKIKTDRYTFGGRHTTEVCCDLGDKTFFASSDRSKFSDPSLYDKSSKLLPKPRDGSITRQITISY
jgi:hypothetical protein